MEVADHKVRFFPGNFVDMLREPRRDFVRVAVRLQVDIAAAVVLPRGDGVWSEASSVWSRDYQVHVSRVVLYVKESVHIDHSMVLYVNMHINHSKDGGA